MRTYTHKQGSISGVKLAELQSATKRMNTRLRQLEKSNLSQASNWYKYVERLQFDDSSIITKDKQGRVKIRTDITKMSRSDIKTLKNFLEKTNESVTSTVTGVRRMYQKGFDTYKQNNETNITIADYSNLYNDTRFKACIQKYGYSETMELVSMGISNGIDINEILEDMLKSDSILEIRIRLSKPQMQEEYNINDNDFQNVDDFNLNEFLYGNFN